MDTSKILHTDNDCMVLPDKFVQSNTLHKMYIKLNSPFLFFLMETQNAYCRANLCVVLYHTNLTL